VDNPTTDQKLELGRLLFFDPLLSSDRELACATCHSEYWGLGDGLAVSVGALGGTLAGPGRSGPNVTRRNSTTLWNAAFRTTLFWDGHATSLEEQIHFPLESPLEMGRTADELVADLRAIPGYASLFAAAFPDATEPVTLTNLERAIAAYERTLVSNQSLYDGYVDGDPKALRPDALRGMQLFADTGCAGCHVPPLFSSDRFEDRGVGPIPGVDDAGRFEVTGVETDRNRFAVPTLRNVVDSGPFFHTGAVTELIDAVRHEVEYAAAHGEGRSLDESGIQDVTAFLRDGLSDPTNAPVRPREVPSGLPIPRDGFNITR
jgi:cytochrome c peroxidase